VTDREGGSTVPPLVVQVVLGPCDDMRAEVFVRAATPDAAGPVQLAGTLSGPECRRSITLPVAAPLADLGGSGSGLLAKTLLTEPAFWTPELPNLYRLDVRATAGGQTVAECTRRIGLRRSGIRGRSLWLEGRRWVPRGVACEPTACDLESLRAAGAVAVVSDPPESLLTAADTSGLAVITVVQPTDGQPLAIDDAVHCIAIWAAHPSVVMTVIDDGADDIVATLAARVQRLKGTMLLGRVVDGAAPPPLGRSDGIDCLVLSLDADTLPHEAWRDAAPPLPLVAWRRASLPAQERRRGCDQLQAALAAWGLADGRSHQPWDWAGYLVS
jgi:hypothetical protein